MSLSRINPAQTKAWTALQDHFNQDNTSDIKVCLNQNPIGPKILAFNGIIST